MIAFGTYNPAMITIFLDRREMSAHLVVQSDEWQEDLEKFLAQEDERTQVLLVPGLDMLTKLKEVNGLDACHVAVFDSPRRLSTLTDVEMLDAKPKGEDIWQRMKLDPAAINDALLSMEPGLDYTLDVVKSTAPKVATQPGELSGMLTELCEDLSYDIKSYFQTRVCQYLTGQVEKRSLGGAKRKVTSAGVDKKSLDKITKYTESKKGRALRDAYILITHGKDTAKACELTEADINELNFVVQTLQEDPEFVIDVKEILKSYQD